MVAPARDHMAAIRLNSIREMARDKAGLAKQHRNVIARTDEIEPWEYSARRRWFAPAMPEDLATHVH